MEKSRWLSRHFLSWLLAAQLALIAPHSLRLPLWISAVWLLCACWRVMVYQGRWSFPGRAIKTLLVVGSIAGIRFSYSSVVGLEPMVALLVTCFSFKLVEAATRRDAYLLLFLGYFIALTEFLFEQGLGVVLFMLLPIVLLTAALVALQQQEPLHFSWQPLRKAAAMAAQALPLMLLLFLVFPRIAPLWRVPLPGGEARTGITDRLSPGDIAQLSKSDELAFRAAFTGAVPPARALYWRGLVLDEFDGRSWRAGNAGNFPLTRPPQLQGSALDYQVYLEPTDQRWLFALEVPSSVDAKTVLTIDYRLLAKDLVSDKFIYRARAYPQASVETSIDPRWQRHQLQLPGNVNPRTLAWAKRLREQNADDAVLIDAVLANFRSQPFFYTLKPPRLGEHSIDEFLFDSRRGFCEHYASSFVFVLRAAGIPARVVVGYQGGEINPLTGTVLVHQFDAHAWAEAWLAGRGWVRFDPTAAVAPQRIEQGLERAIGADEFLAETPFSASRYRDSGLLNALRLRIDAINFAWTRWVVNYRDEAQTDVLRRLLGEITPLRMSALMLGGGAATITVAALLFWGRQLWQPRLPPEQRYYQRFCRRLARRGYPRLPGMAPGEYCRWLLRQRPGWELVREITECFERLSYARLSAVERQQLLARLRHLARARLDG